MDYKDYYATLGVQKEATPQEVQKAYRSLARKHHPDVNQETGAEDKFKEITEAYEVLKDTDKRARYDQFGSAWKQAQHTGGPPPGFEDVFSRFGGGGHTVHEFDLGGQGFSSFFDALFGGGDAVGGFEAQGFPRGFSSGGAQTGGDLEATIRLTLEEAALGGQKEISIGDPQSGRQRKLRVKIPKGVRPGQKIRLAGQGRRSARGGQRGKRGHLYLTVELLPHPRLRLEGNDLYTTLPVTPWEAALGGQAKVATLNGTVTVKIPAGSSSGRRIRLSGKGFPVHTGPDGDLYAEINLVVPPQVSPRERELFEELAKTSSFKPRGD